MIIDVTTTRPLFYDLIPETKFYDPIHEKELGMARISGTPIQVKEKATE